MRLGLVGLACLGGCAGSTEYITDTGTGTTSTGVTRLQTILAIQGVAADGANEYTQQCLVCHPRPGDEPGPYPPLDEVVPLRNDTQLVTVLLVGLVTSTGAVAMPDYAEYFTNQQMADLVAYMRATFPGGVP